MTHPTNVGDLYDRLLSSEANKLEADNLTIHKRLRFPNNEFSDINDWIISHVDLPEHAHILDAGCGVGGTLFALLDGNQHTGIGITLSQQQVDIARIQSSKLSLAERCSFIQHSYDEPLNEQFDLIISIEALLHSADLTASVQNLGQHLKPAGQLLIIEDIAKNELTGTPLTDIWKQSWSIEHIYSQQAYQQAFKAAGLKPIDELDFTPFVPTKNWPGWLIQLAWHVTKAIPNAWIGAKDIFIGGWALERLYQLGLINYRAILAKRV